MLKKTIIKLIYNLFYPVWDQIFMYRYLLEHTPADAKSALFKEFVLQPYEIERRYWEEQKLQRLLKRWRRYDGIMPKFNP